MQSAEGMFQAAKNAITSKAAQVYLNGLLTRYGEVQRVKIDSTERTIAITVRLKGDELRHLKKVWIGDKVVFDAATSGVPATKELLVGRQILQLDQKKTLLVTVQLGDLPPIVVAEAGTKKAWVLEGP